MALVSLAGTGTGSAPTPSRAAAWQHVRHLPAALLSGVLSVLAFALATRLSPADVALPWGRGDRDSGDAASLYNCANTVIREGWFSYNPSLGFPVGMDAAGIQQAELQQWAELWFITRIVADPFVALNAFYVLGFFAVGFCAYLLFRATGCAILQLPVMEFPEDWRFNDMAAYDHFWVTLVAPEQRWSFGIVTGSGEHAAVREVYGIATPIPSLVQAARSDGYCGIHADRAGLTPADQTLLVQELGSPSVATERWSFFVL